MAFSAQMNEIHGQVHRKDWPTPFATMYLRVYEKPVDLPIASTNLLRGEAMDGVSGSQITRASEWVDKDGRAKGIQVTAQVVRTWED